MTYISNVEISQVGIVASFILMGLTENLAPRECVVRSLTWRLLQVAKQVQQKTSDWLE